MRNLTAIVVLALGCGTASTAPCGATGEACCSGTACNAGLVCQGSACVPQFVNDAGPICAGAACLNLFAGNWGVSGSALWTQPARYGGGVETMQGTTASPLAQYQITFARGTDTDLVSVDNFGCALKWSLSGSTASMLSGQSCTAGGSTFLLATGGVSLTPVDATHLSGVADATGLCRGGACSANGVGMLTRR